MKRRLLALGLALILVSILVACSKEPGDVDIPEPGTEEPRPGTDDETFKIGIVTDKHFSYEGLMNVERDLGVEIGYQEYEDLGDSISSFESLLDDDYDLIWGLDYILAEAIKIAATDNPDRLFGLVDYSYGEDIPNNLVEIAFKSEESSFLVGYIAGKMTKTDKVGFVGGVEEDITWEFDYGFQAGVKYAAKELGKDIDVLSRYIGNFSDVDKGNTLATNMYQQGRDIVFHAAGEAGVGIISAAKEEDKWVIGFDRDQSHEAPEHVLTSAIKRVDIGIHKVIESLIAEEFPGGETVAYGLQDDGAVDIAPTSSKHVPAEILDRVEELKQEIIDGKIVVPFNEGTYEVYMMDLNN